MRVNLFDNNFRHTQSALGFDSASLTRPERMEWVRDNPSWKGVTVFTDEMCLTELVDNVKSDLKVAWLMEPPSIKSIANHLKYVQHKFDLILSYLPLSSLEIDERKYRWIPSGGAWVKPQENFNKTRLVSLIASSKKITYGHRLRHEVANLVNEKVDLLGGGYKPFDRKEDGHNPYMFSIVIENEKFPRFFSEKLLDCFLCRCVPIYWGAHEIGDIFDTSGILYFNSPPEIPSIINRIDIGLYDKMIDSIDKNYIAASQIKSTDDIIHDLLVRELNKGDY
jgi:hypothetical protein